MWVVVVHSGGWNLRRSFNSHCVPSFSGLGVPYLFYFRLFFLCLVGMCGGFPRGRAWTGPKHRDQTG